MMIEWLFTFLIVYLVYKLIFDFILPVSKASSQLRSKMNQMNQQQQAQQRNAYTEQRKSTTNVRPEKEDYIDFEEVK